jgi:cathepsin C
MEKLALLSILLIVVPALCDLPVHCLKSQIVGDWKLMLSDTKMKGQDIAYNIGKGLLSCGHDTPDQAETSNKAKQFRPHQSLHVRLTKHNRVHDEAEPHKEGTWTMVYDEGFEIRLKGITYFAFNKYDKQESGQYESHCGETLVGWYHNTNTDERGCYRAMKLRGNVGASDEAHNDHVV